jgi:AraC-like DNA-binding protein
VHAPLLLHFTDVVESCGGDAATLLIQAGIDSRQAPSGVASYRQTAEVLERAASSLARPDFGMLLAQRQCEDGIEGPLGRVMRHGCTFRDVLELAVKHSYAHSLASRTWLRRSAPNSILFGHDILLPGLTAANQLMEQILLIGHLMAIRLTGGLVRARAILLRHERLSARSVYRRYFGCEVRFGEHQYATAFRERDLVCPIVSADPVALRQALSAVVKRFQDKQPPLTQIVRGTIVHAIEERACTCAWVAGHLGLHLRTLHRRLRSEGSSFRTIKDEVRRDLARYYLCNTHVDLKAIAERLGFSEQSALTRRSHTWFNCKPSGLRLTKPTKGSARRRKAVRLGQVAAKH